MNVGEASRVTGLPIKTIRYYDEIGLVHPDRDNNGYRQFDEYSVHKLHFVKRARGLGFSVGDCRTLLSLYEDQDRSSADVKLIAQEHLTSVETKIAQMRQFRNALVDLVDSCNGDHRPECPILDGLSGTTTNETQH